MRKPWVVVVSLVGLAISAGARAGKPAAESEAAAPAAAPPGPRPQLGPAKIDLGDDLVLDLPEGMGYFDRAKGKALMEKMGNRTGDDLRGLVFQRDRDWVVVLKYVGDGYVKDDDAAKLNPDDILKSISEGTEEANEFRKEKGMPAVHVDAWTESPHYERGPHHLIWGIRGKLDDGSPASVNFYTRVLGRHGFVALNLMDDAATIETSKKEALGVLRATTFKPGSRYEDFDSKSDKVAEYGLAALVVGGAGAVALKVAKVGLLAKFGGKLIALIIAGKKAIVLLFVGIGAAIKKFFGVGKKESAPAAGPPPVDPPAPPAP